MSQVALVRNPHSTRNLKSATGALAIVPENINLIDCSGLGELSAELEAAHAAGAEIILIDGGDGTVREVLSRVPDLWGASLPRIGILPRGNTNLIAREVGGLNRKTGAAEVLRRLEAGQELPVRYRPLLRVDYPEEEHRTLRGFILGWGAYAEGTRIARREIAMKGTGQVTLAALSTLRRTMFGANRRKLRRGVVARMSIDDAAPVESSRLVGVATTLQGPLIAGMNPFWGSGPGAIRWMDVQAPGRWLALATPFLATGSPRRWMKRSGYASGMASRIVLDLETSFIMDGELFPPSSGPLTLTADEKIGFISF